MILECGIICATREEREALSAVFEVAESGGAPPFGVVDGVHAGVRLHLAQGGIGKAAAAALTAHMLTRSPEIDLMVFCGVAGGMNPELHPGDLVVAMETATHDYGALRTGEHQWYPAGAIPIGPAPPASYEPATTRTRALERTTARFADGRASPRVLEGRVISGDVFLNCPARRDQLQATWNADAIDMESSAVAETCRRFGKALLVLRTLSDRACEESHLSYADIAASAARNSAEFLKSHLEDLAADPESIAQLRGSSPSPAARSTTEP